MGKIMTKNEKRENCLVDAIFYAWYSQTSFDRRV